MKITFLFLLILSTSVFGGDLANQRYRLDSTFFILMQKNKNTIDYFSKSYDGLLSEKEKLLHTIRFNCAPSLDISRKEIFSNINSSAGLVEHVSTVVKGSLEINEWDTYFDVNPMKYGYGNTGGIMVPVLSSTKKKALILDTLIGIVQKKTNYQIENIYLQELKSIWALIVGIEQIEEEIAIRKQVDKQIDSIGFFLSNFSKAGLISKRSIHLFKLTFLDNKMQISLLEKRKELYRNQLQNQYFIQEIQADRIIEENRPILMNLRNMHAKNVIDRKGRTLADCVDSLNIYEIEKRRKYDTYNDYSMKIGPTIYAPGSIKEFSVGAGAQFTISFIAKKSGVNEKVKQPVPVEHYYCDTISPVDSSIIDESNQYIAKIEEEAGNIIEELKSGTQYSLLTLTDLYSRIISVKTNILNLQYSFLSYKAGNIHSLEEIGLRNDLITFLSGHK